MTITWADLFRAEEELRRMDTEYVFVVHPRVYNGFWSIHQQSRLLRWVGRKLHSRRIYWLGLNVRWITGLKDL